LSQLSPVFGVSAHLHWYPSIRSRQKPVTQGWVWQYRARALQPASTPCLLLTWYCRS